MKAKKEFEKNKRVIMAEFRKIFKPKKISLEEFLELKIKETV